MSRECSACTRPSENKHFDCPPRMADGRLFTDYRPRCDYNYVVDGLTADTPMDSYAYRQYLINNAGSLMTKQRAQSYSQSLCGPCTKPYNIGTMLPEKYVTTCDGKTCSVKLNDPRGIGIGRSYGQSAEEQAANSAFLQRKDAEQQYLSGNANCCAASPADRMAYAAPAGTPTAAMRAAVPSGGAALSGGDAVRF